MKQAGVPYLKEQWYQSEQMTTINNNFYTSICKCIFSQNRKLALAALNGLKTTRKLNSQLVSQFCTFAFYTYVGGVGKKDLILIMIRILARNPSTALIQPGTGVSFSFTIFFFTFTVAQTNLYNLPEKYNSLLFAKTFFFLFLD